MDRRAAVCHTVHLGNTYRNSGRVALSVLKNNCVHIFMCNHLPDGHVQLFKIGVGEKGSEVHESVEYASAKILYWAIAENEYVLGSEIIYNNTEMVIGIKFSIRPLAPSWTREQVKEAKC